MHYDFDEIIERRNTGSTKWSRYGAETLPMWVADMDFRAPPAILDAIHERVDHGVFGYGGAPSDQLVETVLNWLQVTYDWSCDPQWLVFLPGLVCGLNVTSRAIAEPGDQILTATPVYFHLFKAPANFGCEALTIPMAQDSQRDFWSLDLDRINQSIGPRAKGFMLCNPHNPVGRVYRRDELIGLAELCERHDLVLCADEIHCQLTLEPDQPHIPIASLDEQIAQRTITLMAPSKTYNIPGLGCSFAIIANPELRERFQRAKLGIVPHVNVLGYPATLAAYRDSGPWLEALIEYLRGNRDWLSRAVERLPGVRMTPMAATYLAWLDFRDSGLEDPAGELLAAGVALSAGEEFGSPGYMRLNFGCPRSTLVAGFERIERAVLG